MIQLITPAGTCKLRMRTVLKVIRMWLRSHSLCGGRSDIWKMEPWAVNWCLMGAEEQTSACVYWCVCVSVFVLHVHTLSRPTTDLSDSIKPLILFTMMARGSDLCFRFSELHMFAVDGPSAREGGKTWRLGSCSSTEIVTFPKQELKHPALLELALKWELAYSAPMNIWMSLQIPSGLLRYSRYSGGENNVAVQPAPPGCNVCSTCGFHMEITVEQFGWSTWLT